MRIAYISLHWARSLSSGVGKKIHRQIETWKSLGHEARLFMHTENARVPDLLLGEKFFYPSQSGIPQREFGRVRAAKEMLQAVKSYQPDLIYLRYGIYIYPIHRLASIAPIIEEINTNDIEQHKELGIIYSSYNRFTRGILLRSVSGLNCVSKELAEAPVFRNFQKPTRVIANGINLSKFSILDAPNNNIPRIVFIGTPGYSWQGVDKLVDFAYTFPDLRIDIVGYDRLNDYSALPSNLKLHGYLKSEDYQKVMAQCDIGIGTLALHRKGMEEACPLKTRECLAYGLPMVLPYRDTDLDTLNTDFLLKIPNTEDNILTHGKLIRDFAYQMRGRRVDRELIVPYLDSQEKERQRLAFFEKILQIEK